MKSAAERTVSTFGVLAAIAGAEHGLGEILQGSVKPESTFILSWPDAPFFQILSGEPAMTLIPNLLVSGILTILLSLAFFVTAVWFIHRRWSGLALLLLSLLLLLVGGGFGPPILGTILGLTALRIHARKPARTGELSSLRRFLGNQWVWVYACGLLAWLMLFPILNLLDTFTNVVLADWMVYGVIASAFGFLLLAIFTGLARDRVQQAAG